MALTGIVSEIMRLAQFGLLMYLIYYVHLVLIFALFLYAPYSKFAHLAYRTVALAAAEPWRAKGSGLESRGEETQSLREITNNGQ